MPEYCSHVNHLYIKLPKLIEINLTFLPIYNQMQGVFQFIYNLYRNSSTRKHHSMILSTMYPHCPVFVQHLSPFKISNSITLV